MFPAESPGLLDLYNASDVPQFAKVFDYERDFTEVYTSREMAMNSSGMTETEAANHCFVDFESNLASFDEQFRGQAEIYRQYMETTTSRVEKKIAADRKTKESEEVVEIEPIFSAIIEQSNYGYESGDWSRMAMLYEPGTFDCWSGADESHNFAYLSIPPIPESATYETEELAEYFLGSGYAFTNVQPTHLLTIRYETSHDWSRCNLAELNLYPSHHFFLTEVDGEFGLTHFCPSEKLIQEGGAAGNVISARQATENLAALDRNEWERIPEEIDGNKYSSRTANRLYERYGFQHDEAMAVIHEICKPVNTR